MAEKSSAHIVGNGDSIAVFLDADIASLIADEILAMRLVIGMSADSDAATTLMLAMALRSAALSEDPVSHRVSIETDGIDGKKLLQMVFSQKTVDAE